jgi:medium-chain acyl-[acyl-carrier-protein] hydrolase
MDDAEIWFKGTGKVCAPVRLFYFPYAGGNPAAILPWQAELADSVELLVALLPGHGVRCFEPPLTDLESLVDRLAGEVARLADRPFAFYGHSLGALVAFEVARELRRRGLPGPAWLCVSGAEGPQTRLVRQQLRDLPDAELIEALRDYGGSPAELLADPEMMRLLLPGIRADFALSEQYHYRAEPPLELPIQVLCALDDPYVEVNRTAGWARETTRPLRERTYPGNHFFIQPHRAEIAALVVAELDRARVSPPA